MARDLKDHLREWTNYVVALVGAVVVFVGFIVGISGLPTTLILGVPLIFVGLKLINWAGLLPK